MSTQQDTLNPLIDDFINKLSSINNVDNLILRVKSGAYMQLKNESVKEIKQKLADKSNQGLRLIIVHPNSGLDLVEDQFSSCTCQICPECYTKYYSIVIVFLVIIIIFLIYLFLRKK